MPWPQMNPAELRHSVVIQSLSEERDENGGFPSESDDANWTDLVRARAKVSPVTGRELQEAGKQQGEVSTTITLRYQPGITDQMRVKNETTGQYWDIRAVLNQDGRNLWLKLLCRERD